MANDKILYIENSKEYTHTIRTSKQIQQGCRVKDQYTKVNLMILHNVYFHFLLLILSTVHQNCMPSQIQKLS